MSDRLKDLIGGLIILAIFLAVHLFQLPFAIAVSFTLLFAVLFHAQLLGKYLLPSAGWLSKILLGIVTFLALQSLFQTAWFYLGPALGNASDTWSAAGAMIIAEIIPWLRAENEPATPAKDHSWNAQRIIFALLIGAGTLGAAAFVVFGAFRVATIDSIRTPWPLLPAGTLLAIALTWLGVVLMAWLVESFALSAALSSIALFSTTAIAPLVYRTGFGFDGFLHVATEKIILATGTLTPKPLYYIGQYVFTTWLARSAALPIDQIDRWLVPVATALLLPFALFASRKKNDLPSLAFCLFLIPLSAFIATTPQSFAYLLGIAALLLARSTDDGTVSPLAPLILAAWSVAVHPLAGVPILFLVVAVIALRPYASSALRTASRIVAITCVILAALSVPLLFYILSLKGTTNITWNGSQLLTLAPWNDLLNLLLPWPQNAFVIWPGWSSLVAHALPCLLIAANIAAIIRAKRSDRWQPAIFLGTALLLFITAAALKTVGDFAFLIDYERGNYADRLNLIAAFCLIPSALPIVAELLQRAKRSPPLLGASVLMACVLIAAAVSYDSLPRNDALVVGHGWSVGQADIDAVRAIDRDSAHHPYTVLADQSVSAAAVSQLGFKRYNGDVFFYPIPTGGDLYNVFLQMTYDNPSRDTVMDAAKLGGTDIVYVVLNDYWWNATNLKDALSAIADTSWAFGDATKGPGHSVTVYKFDLKASSKRATATPGS